jgi:hypothetical protein
MTEAAEAILYRVRHHVLTDDIDALAEYLEKLAIKRQRRLKRNEDRKRARSIETY